MNFLYVISAVVPASFSPKHSGETAFWAGVNLLTAKRDEAKMVSRKEAKDICNTLKVAKFSDIQAIRVS